MAELCDNALLLRRIPYSESSLICHFLTQKHGRISLMVRGARRIKSPFRAALSPLYHIHIHWQEGRTGMGQLRAIQRFEALLNEQHSLLGLELLSHAQFFFQEGDEHAYDVVRDALSLLAQRKNQKVFCKESQVCIWVSILIMWRRCVKHV